MLHKCVCISQMADYMSGFSFSMMDSEGPTQVVRFAQKMLFPPSHPICPKGNLSSGTNQESRQFRKCPAPVEPVGKASAPA